MFLMLSHCWFSVNQPSIQVMKEWNERMNEPNNQPINQSINQIKASYCQARI